MVMNVRQFDEIGVFAHEVCDGSVRDKDER